MHPFIRLIAVHSNHSLDCFCTKQGGGGVCALSDPQQQAFLEWKQQPRAVLGRLAAAAAVRVGTVQCGSWLPLYRRPSPPVPPAI